jgi:excinuclease UvrABC nuclease subunit
MSIGNWSSFHTPYNESQVRIHAPDTAGVYTLWVQYKGGRWGCYYVGKAENIKKRLLEHLSNEEENECIINNRKFICGFMWNQITAEKERAGVEKYLYDKLKPECNQIDPGGEPIEIPLPSPK